MKLDDMLEIIAQECNGKKMCYYNSEGKLSDEYTAEVLKTEEIPDDLQYISNKNITRVEMVGGDEGDGERMHIVFKVTDDEDFGFVKFEGRYNSYGESYFYKCYKVKPVEKTIIVYEV